MKKSVYLDTTIPSYLFDRRSDIKTYVDVTNKWWNEEQCNFDIWTSNETIAEISRGDYPDKEKILGFISGIDVLPFNDEIIEVAQVYLNNFVMPLTLTGDAIHLAYASILKIDFLLTWNCNHLANANKRQHIRIINAQLGLFVPEIVTPLELFTEETDAN
ncbi:MAG: type II toxin-antitoxin system VapC family toxin [Candidatus Anammoxibacter sp.]